MPASRESSLPPDAAGAGTPGMLQDWLSYRAAASPGRVALEAGGRTWTYRDLETDVSAIARQLGLLFYNIFVSIVSPVVTLQPMEPQICKMLLAFTNSIVISIAATAICIVVGAGIAGTLGAQEQVQPPPPVLPPAPQATPAASAQATQRVQALSMMAARAS